LAVDLIAYLEWLEHIPEDTFLSRLDQKYFIKAEKGFNLY